MDDFGPLLPGCDPWTCTDRAGGEHGPNCEVAPTERRAETRRLVENADGSVTDAGLMQRFANPVVYGPAITGEAS